MSEAAEAVGLDREQVYTWASKRHRKVETKYQILSGGKGKLILVKLADVGDGLLSGAECPLARRTGGRGSQRPGMSALRLRSELRGMAGLANFRAGILAAMLSHGRSGEK